MKDIKTRAIVKDIKLLDRLPSLMERVRHSSDFTKQQSNKDRETPNDYAKHRSESAIDTMVRAPIEMSVVINKRWIRRIQKKRTKSEDHPANDRKPAATTNYPSGTRQTRLTRRLHLCKPKEGGYLLSPDHPSGKQHFIRGRVNARLLHSSRKGSFPDQMLNRAGRYQEPAGKKSVSAAAASYSANARVNRRPNVLTSENLRKQYPKPSSRIRSSISKQAGHTIKQKERKFKTLSSFIKTGQRLGQAKDRSDTRVEGKRSSDRAMRQTVQMAMNARRTIERTQAAARLNLRIIKMVVKAAAMLIKGMAALLGISSSVIVLLCIVMVIAAVISSPFSIFVSGENMDADVKPLSQIVKELDTEFADRLAEIQQSAGNVDLVDIQYSGTSDNTRMDNWADIIAVFAVKTVMDSENGMDVATLDATRIGIIHSVFWDMNQLDSNIETIEHTETVTVEHEDGSTSEETTTRQERILHITVSSKTAEQQATAYHFTSELIDIMNEMMSGEFRPLLFAMLAKESDIGLTPE